jgi:hypothetical protein
MDGKNMKANQPGPSMIAWCKPDAAGSGSACVKEEFPVLSKLNAVCDDVRSDRTLFKIKGGAILYRRASMSMCVDQ